MDGPRRSGDAFTLQSLYIAAGVTFLCCLFALWSSLHRFLMAPRKGMAVESVRSSKKQCGCSCSCGGGFGGEGYSGSAAGHANGEVVAGEKGRAGAAEGERQVGASMMEQLVPEITTHALSYLDYPSLCRLSMTNSSMRRAANDDSAWKALYHKDFTVEQDGITPVNGWKAYYAATKAVVDVNAEFYNIIKNRSLLAMSRLWLHADYVKCVHGSGELFSGYTSVMDSWELALNWGQGGQGVAFEIRDVRARVQGEMAWVIMKAYVDMESGPSNVTNVFEFHDGRWYMVHHHSSVMLVDGDAGHHHGFV